MSPRNVTPIVPKNEQKQAMLKDDLIGLGCEGLLEQPWNLKNKEFVQQFMMIRKQETGSGSRTRKKRRD